MEDFLKEARRPTVGDDVDIGIFGDNVGIH